MHKPALATVVALVGFIAAPLAGQLLSLPGGSAPVLAGNGRYVVFTSSVGIIPPDGNGLPDIYELDINTGIVQLCSGASGPGGASVASSRHEHTAPLSRSPTR